MAAGVKILTPKRAKKLLEHSKAIHRALKNGGRKN